MCIYESVWIHISIKTPTGLCYTSKFTTKTKKKQKEFKNVMSFRGKNVSTGQLYKPLAEKHKCREYSN